jgi:hypothetical protein
MKQSGSKLAALPLLCPQAAVSILVWLPDWVRVPVWHDSRPGLGHALTCKAVCP